MTWLILAGQAGGLAVAYFAQTPLLSAAGALLFIGLAVKRLDLALMMALAVTPFYLPNESNPLPPRPLGFDGWSLTLIEFALLACTTAWGVRAVWDNRSTMRAIVDGKLSLAKLVRQAIGALSPAVVVFAIVATGSLFTTFYLKYALREYRTVVVEPLLFYAMMLTAFRERPARLGAVYVGVGVGVSIIALAHYWLVGTVESTGGVRRVLAIYHSPNALALFLERPLTLAAVLAVASKGEQRLPWLAGAAVMLPTLVLTYSRGAWLAVCIGLLFAVAVKWVRWLPAVVMAMAAGTIGLLASDRVARLTSTVTAGRRVSLWLSGLAMVRDHPITGIGLDNFLYYYRDRGYMLPAAAVEPNLSHPHNLILDWWLRIGVLGPLVLAWLVTTFFRDGFRIWRKSSIAGHRELALGLMAGMVAGLVHGFVDNSFFLVDLAVSFWVIYGLMRLLRGQLST